MVGLWLDAVDYTRRLSFSMDCSALFQEGKARKPLDSIRNMLSAEARALRGGETRMVPAEDLVPGDIVLLESGDRDSGGFRLSRSKEPSDGRGGPHRQVGPRRQDHGAAAAESDRRGPGRNRFFGNAGRLRPRDWYCRRDWPDTELGRINQMMAAVSALETPLLRQIKKFGYAITAVVGVVTVHRFYLGRWVRGMDFVEIFQAVVSQLAVSVIPERVAALITVTLAIGVQRMAQRQCDHTASTRRGNTWFGIPDLLRQDRYTNTYGDDGVSRGHW